MSNNKDFNCFYYSLETTNSSDLEGNLKSFNKPTVIIEHLSNKKYFLEIPYESHRTSIIFSGKESDDPRNLKPIDVPEDELFYYKVFVLVDFTYNNIFQNSKGVISILKSGHEVSIEGISKLFREIFSESNLGISPIKYQQGIIEYLEGRKLKKVEVKFANPSYGRPLFVDSNCLESLWKSKEELGGDIMSFIIGTESQYGMSLEKFKNRFIGNRDYFNKASVTVLDNFGKEIQQQIDEIRFRNLINLTIKDRDFISEEVKNAMNDAFNNTITEIKEEYKVL